MRSGDTLAGIAQAIWGDASLWYKLAEANGLSGSGGGSASLTQGTTLVLPAGVVRSTYNASTLEPYNPADAIGGAAASVVSQGVGVALGIQEKFSWSEVALAGRSGIGAGLGGGIPGARPSPMSGEGLWAVRLPKALRSQQGCKASSAFPLSRKSAKLLKIWWTHLGSNQGPAD